MKNLTLVVILFAIVAFTVAGYFLISKFGSQNTTEISQSPTVALSPTPTTDSVPTATQTALCQQSQLTGNISAQGAAGNIYATLELTNTGKAACTVTLGNTITAMFDAKNIVIHYQKTNSSQTFLLASNAKVYSQVHYPNGPQCQSGIVGAPLTFLYKTDQTSVTFEPNQQTEKLIVQACKSPTEKTTIDIWPLSKNPINQ